MLDQVEIEAWQAFVKDKLESSGGWMNLHRFEARLEELMLEISADPTVAATVAQRNVNVLQNLALHAQDIRSRYQL